MKVLQLETLMLSLNILNLIFNESEVAMRLFRDLSRWKSELRENWEKKLWYVCSGFERKLLKFKEKIKVH